MHQPISDHLETYMRDSEDPSIPREFRAHLMVCRSCADELDGFVSQSRLLGMFREREQLDPPAGFYARVLNQIEQQRKSDSFWSLFLEPAFGRPLFYACSALLLVLGTYLISTEPGDTSTAPSVVVWQQLPSKNIDGTILPRQRDAVLVNLASFHE